ncbi:MAG: sigma-54 dependent transcriptional regulator [Acidobacteriota bacterium]|nr:sigma-54 dependent transcriptional regulator [Acidobacteriota bacterium]
MLLNAYMAITESSFKSELSAALDRQDVRTTVASGPGDLLRELSGKDFDLVLVSRSLLPEPGAGAIAEIKGLPEQPGVVVFASEPNEQDRAELLAAGCLAVLSETITPDVLRSTLDVLIARQRASAMHRLKVERPEERFSLTDFVSDSPVMQDFMVTARKIVRSDSSLLLLGETGVGKGRLARSIHAEGPRSRGPFVAVQCAALPEGLLESELFGHEAGAFTGASRARKGYFELAHEGTLFLDEIGEIPPHLQVKLLMAIDERRVRRLGAEKPIRIDVRIVAATNRDLEEAMERGEFRSDLFYRLAVVTLTIPPLRERREDIPRLAMGYLEHFRQQTGRSDITIDAGAADLIHRYDWPGNVRELINALERAVLLCSKNHITVEDLPRRIVTASAADSGNEAINFSGGEAFVEDGLFDMELPQARAELVSGFERAYVSRFLESTKGRVGEAARRAGINQRHLYELMRRHGLKKEDFKAR